MTFYTNKTLIPPPLISLHKIRPNSILNMVVILVFWQPLKVTKKTGEIKRLTKAVNSGRNLLNFDQESQSVETNYQKTTYLKGSFTIFWLTNRIPRKFPKKSFFVWEVSSENIQMIYSTLFVVKIQKSFSKIILICNHCSWKSSVDFIEAGYISHLIPEKISWTVKINEEISFHEKLHKMVEELAPVSFISAEHAEGFREYESDGCEYKLNLKNPDIASISESGVFCGANITIYHTMIRYANFKEGHTSEPFIYDETLVRPR